MSARRMAAWSCAGMMLGVWSAAFPPAAAAESDAQDLAHCASITASDERLACYDAVAAGRVNPTGPPATGSAPSASSPVAAPPANNTTPPTASQTTAPSQGTTSASTAAAPRPTVSSQGNGAPSPPAAPTTSQAAGSPGGATTPAGEVSQFGLTPRQMPLPRGPDSIAAVVSQVTMDRLNNVLITLDNGQSWTLVDPQGSLRPGDSVRIKRAALGSFLMTTPRRRSFRVERVR